MPSPVVKQEKKKRKTTSSMWRKLLKSSVILGCNKERIANWERQVSNSRMFLYCSPTSPQIETVFSYLWSCLLSFFLSNWRNIFYCFLELWRQTFLRFNGGLCNVKVNYIDGKMHISQKLIESLNAMMVMIVTVIK